MHSLYFKSLSVAQGQVAGGGLLEMGACFLYFIIYNLERIKVYLDHPPSKAQGSPQTHSESIGHKGSSVWCFKLWTIL